MAGYALQGGFNPFLMDAEPSPADQFGGAPSAASNPFLSDFTSGPNAVEEIQNANPFLSFSSNPAPVPEASNPFAQFISASTTENSWGIENSQAVNTSPFYSAAGYGEDQPGCAPMVPRSTQDLLQTVTGSLEATSDSLLDRLRMAQPSPVPMPPSPTPSPRSPSPDLWGEEDSAPQQHHHINPPTAQPEPVNSLLDLYQSAPNTSGPKSSIDILGLYNTFATTSTTTTQPVSIVASIESFVIESQPEDSNSGLTALEGVEATPAAPAAVDPILAPAAFSAAAVVEPVLPEPAPVLMSPPAEDVTAFNPPAIPPTFTPPVAEPIVQQPPPAAPVFTTPKAEAVFSPPQPVFATPKAEPVFSPPKPIATPELDLSYAQPGAPTVQEPFPPPFVAAAAPERPKPPPVPAMGPRKPMPNRPPPPVPPAPRAQPPPVPTMHVAHSAVDPFQEARGFQAAPPSIPQQPIAQTVTITTSEPPQDFDSFDAKFNSLVEPEVDSANKSPSPFDSFAASSAPQSSSAWGDPDEKPGGFNESSGFGASDGFDSFLALTEPPPVPQSTPAKSRVEGRDYDDSEKEDTGFKIVIRDKDRSGHELRLDLNATALAPPPKSPAAMSTGSAFSEEGSAFVPFLSAKDDSTYAGAMATTQMNRTDSQETPQTPLFEEDQSQPLEDFPRTKYIGDGWEMHMRHPNKKKITGQRFWKKVFVRLAAVNDVQTVQIYSNKTDKDPFQEFPLQPSYSVSDIAAQQFDQFGKIFTIKLQYVFYKERPGIRPGQITKAERITNKLSQFAAFAIQGDYQGVKEFGSDLKKLGMPLEHAPQISQLVKLGTQSWEEMKQFSACIEEALFRVPVHRERAINYKSEEVQVTLVDEYYVEQDIYGVVLRQIARVRLYFLSFLSGAAEVELGVNDIRRQGKEVVGRHDIIPIATEEWIRTEDIEFSNCVQLDVFENTKMVKFKPPDACYIELLRFRVRPPRHRELPMQVKTVFTTTGNRIEIRCDILVPGFTSRKLGQIPCEDVMVRIPIPECWIYMFRVEKHFRYGSVKSAHRRSGKVKGIERFLGAVEAVEQSLMEVTSGQAKYEHHHRSIVWRIARLPKEGQGAYTTHSFFCHITLQPHEEIPENLTKHCYVEFTMPHTTISHTVCRSVSVPMCDEPPEKCVKYLSRHEYIVEIDHTHGVAPATYNLAASVAKTENISEEPEPEAPMPGKALSDSDFSDDD